MHQSTGDRWRLGHRPALDGLRGIAILLVFVGHSWLPFTKGAGPAGVTMFFTLSGFLITSLLLEEHARAGRISIANFYRRRARRLLPALAVTIALVASASVWIGGWFFNWRQLLAVVGYAGNWYEAATGHLGGLEGTWSLAVEEQFYVIWPLAMILALRRGTRAVGWCAGIGIVAAAADRALLWANGASQARVYNGSDTHADALLLGCLLAVTMHGSKSRRPLPWAATLTCLGAMLYGTTSGDAVWTVVPVVVPLLTAATIYFSARGTDAGGWLSWRPLTWIGERSYGFYLYHCPVSVYLTIAHPTMPWQLRAPIMLAVAVPLTLLSWRYVEQPILKRRRSVAQARGRNLQVAGAPGGDVRLVAAVPEVDVARAV